MRQQPVEPGPGQLGLVAAMPVLIGTSGWQYRDWRGRFYPERLPQRAWLEYYAARYGGRASPPPCYGRTALNGWARRLADGWGREATAYAFFNNDPRGCAVRDARWFALAAARAGLDPTRVPAAREVRVG